MHFPFTKSLTPSLMHALQILLPWLITKHRSCLYNGSVTCCRFHPRKISTSFSIAMATEKLPKAKWFSNKGLRLSFQRLRSESTGSRRMNYPTTKLGSDSSSPNSPNSPLPMKNNISRQQELKDVFSQFDGDGDGKISALELRAYFASIGEYMSFEDAEGVINELDSDGDNLLDFQDFLRLMKRGEVEEDLKMAFEMFELEKGDGCITPRGLQRMFHRLGDPRSVEECVAMIQVFDADGDGVLDFNEFHQMMA